MVAAFGERYERNDWALGGAVLFAVLVCVVLVFKGAAFLDFVAVAFVPEVGDARGAVDLAARARARSR